jgi:hypothetical protein
LFQSHKGATNGFSKVSWKFVYTLYEALEKKVICSHAILEKKLNTAAGGFREIYEIIKL